VHRDPAATGQAVGPVLEDLQALQQGPGGRRAVERDRARDVLREHGVVDADALVMTNAAHGAVGRCRRVVHGPR